MHVYPPISRGSSPHTRGAPAGRPTTSNHTRIIPAYAGSTILAVAPGTVPQDHPRIRGEHSRKAWSASSGRRIIPAYAGSTPAAGTLTRRLRDHPRIRGEHRPVSEYCQVAKGSSPHTRGAPAGAGDILPLAGIIPAYAGSTSEGSRRRRAPWDHPRIRGEHYADWQQNYSKLGSSPHTRGARLAGERRHPGVGIIPAYAGSTLGNPCNTKDRRRDYTSFPLPVTHPSGGGGS